MYAVTDEELGGGEGVAVAVRLGVAVFVLVWARGVLVVQALVSATSATKAVSAKRSGQEADVRALMRSLHDGRGACRRRVRYRTAYAPTPFNACERRSSYEPRHTL
jgi:hypothetical protein